ncbi:hypothetical protein JOY44_08735 [Phormidium sp. CLA17]|uniref:hypothetical protein n=1 Tax=Leptolyngbya sp. Cla-17 TaxID=2803751 RepID=UPI001492F10C|nr:hypothetical protein [Leptolyngbya sp. Cla-17]MBM0741702.1 hypothetical protein [Leptolyngbya sp. Cla-17]
MTNENPSSLPNPTENRDNNLVLGQLTSGQLWMVNSRRRNGLIIYKQFYAEFAGPGAAVGSFFDVDSNQVLPVGELSLISPEDQEERQKAYLIRRQWIRLTHQLTDNPIPSQRAQMILNQFDNYFGANTVAKIPDEAFALMVGVLPQTVSLLRQGMSIAV